MAQKEIEEMREILLNNQSDDHQQIEERTLEPMIQTGPKPEDLTKSEFILQKAENYIKNK